MATKATATNAQWFETGVREARSLANPELSRARRQQVELSHRIYSKRDDRQAKAWLEGFKSVMNI